MTSPPQPSREGKCGGGGTTTKFGRENSEERCLSRPDARFSPFARPPLGAPKAPSPSGAGCPKPCQLRGRRRTQPAAGRGAGRKFWKFVQPAVQPPSPHPSRRCRTAAGEKESRSQAWDNGPGIGSDASFGELLSATRCLCPEPRPGHRRRPVLEEPEQGR